MKLVNHQVDQHTKMYTTMFIILILLSFIDAITTFKIISDGGYELNPIVNAFIKCLGLTAGLTTIKLLALIFIAWIAPHISIIIALVIAHIWVCWQNIKVLRA